MTIPWLSDEIPYLSAEQMIEVDRAMIEDFDIELIQMMENAGRCLARLARERVIDGVIGYSLKGAPPQLYAASNLGLHVGPLFGDSDLLRIR